MQLSEMIEMQLIIEDFLITKQVEEGRSINTVKAYRYDLAMFTRFLETRVSVIPSIQDISVMDIKAFLADLNAKGYKKTSLGRKIACLKSFFAHAVFMDYIDKNVMDKIKSPRIKVEEHLPKFLDDAEVN